MIDLENARKHFSQHIATFADYGNIKVLDFKNPNSGDYRIRFLFEEDYCRLHISGDLGELIAVNYNNMTWEGFSSFVHNAEYFEEKVKCCNRPLYRYDEDLAREMLDDHLAGICSFHDQDLFESIDEIMDDFDGRTGIGSAGRRVVADLDPDYWEWIGDVGKERTGILELYLLAFRLAKAQFQDGKDQTDEEREIHL